MSTIKKVTRSTPGKVELRADPAGDGTPPRLCGYAAKFGSESCVLYDPDVLVDDDGEPLPFVEVIDPACFDRTLVESPDVVALFNHNSDAVLGRTTSGTLVLITDAEGLWFEDVLPDTQYGRDAKTLVGRGDIRGCSFGFVVLRDKLEQRDGLPALRTLLDVVLFEVTIATAFPAYPETETQLRSLRGLQEAEPSGEIPPCVEWARRRIRLEA